MRSSRKAFPAIVPVATALVLFGILSGWWLNRRLHSSANQLGSWVRPYSVKEGLSNLVNNAQQQIRGGVGLLMAADGTTGFVKVHSVGPNSPAALAGLKGEELISQVDGKSVIGVPVAEVATWIRGFNGTKVELLVQRPNSTNWEAVVVKRVSLKKAIALNNRSPFE